ncbi:MAG: hypothetical protein C0616_09430 [Desulfuromonas sp.]|nr:MAG: hypothetical protein C0616_09430 [Desulfuromonas sp.]
MKLSILTEKKGWILHRKAEEIAQRVPGARINRGVKSAQIVYFINYGYYRQVGKETITIANFTHFNPNFLAKEFEEVARKVDHCVAVSNGTAKVLYELGIPKEKVSVIIVGADESFRPKVTLGIVGRVYPDGRKGEHLLRQLLEDKEVMSDLQIVSANSGWGVPVWNLPSLGDFYRSIDYLLIPSLIEGGPVPFMEALACGTLSITPAIGVVPGFSHIEYQVGDFQSLKEVVLREKESLLEQRTAYNSEIKNNNWATWAEEHVRLFERLLKEKKGVA